MKLAEYIRTWVTPTKFKTFGWAIPRELKKLTDTELLKVCEVADLVNAMLIDETKRRNNV